ncbi:MAG: hypothetical protein QOF93_756 [Verrucomicrobiota bacterium]
MKNKPRRSGFLQIRALVALLLFGAAVCLAKFSIAPPRANNGERERRDVDRPRYMPVAGERGESDELNRMEEEWNNRITYPTGVFNPAWLQAAAVQDSLLQRAIPAGIPFEATADARLALAVSPLALTSSGFTALGPAPLQMTGCSGCYDYTKTEGRVNAIAIDPTTTINGTIVAYLGSVGGGVWKTTNCCSGSTTWSATTDSPLLSTISIDTIAIDPNNHNTIYAGTGDLNYGSFSMGSQGILKSTDAGAHWTVLGADVFGPSLFFQAGQFPQYQAVGKVRVDPNNSNNVVAGTKTGLYFSYDAGNNWTGPCTTNNFSSQRQDITGLELSNVGGVTRILAAVGVRGIATTVQYNLNQNGANGIYKATMPASGCPSDFTPITTNANGFTVGATQLNATSGTPCNMPINGTVCTSSSTNKLGRIDIAVAPSNPSVIYAQVQAIETQASCGGTGCELAAWRSTNGGTTWSQIPGSTGAQLTDCGGSNTDYNQNWYDQGIAVDPNNSDRAFFDTFEIWFWKNGNTTWTDATCGYSGNTEVVHVDQHALAFVPGSSSILLAGSDGGVYATTNANGSNGPTHTQWFNMDNGLNTIEFYSGDISANFATSAAPMANGGAQDNGSSAVTFSGTPTGPVQWQMGVGGDGFFARIDPVGNRFWQGNNGGQLNFCDHAPPVNDCTASGAVWGLDSSPWTNNVASPDIQNFVLPYEIYKGIPGDPVNDCPPSGCAHLIVGTQRVWETITSAGGWAPVSMNLVKGTLGNRSFINQLAFEPKDQSRAIVGTNDGNVQYGHGASPGALGAGATWVDLTAGNAVLPNRPILDVAMDPTTTTAPIGYAAVGGFNANTPTTPGHVFRVVCAADCATFVWSNKTGNLPDIPVDSIIANPKFPQQVFAGTDWGLYYTNDITAVSPTWFRFDTGLPHAMIWDMQIDRGNTTLSVWTRSRGAYAWPLPSAPLLNLTNVVSRKVHGSAGTFDIVLSCPACAGPALAPGIECRSGGTNNSYKMVFSFTNTVTSCGVASAGTVTPGPNSNQCSVDVSVATGNYITVQLSGVTDANTNIGNFSATMGVLVGDTTSNGAVNSSDISQTQSQSGLTLTMDNFREDVTVNGSINSSDISLVQSQSGSALPASPSTAPAASPAPAPPSASPSGTKTKPRKSPLSSGRSR